ncbi:Calx-beta domain-containing protein [Planctomyces sp. SH-PL62]|uniref:Calx-beta domain-containing protein n=1 Tax=Planctomyces sp. SH-PL62 TaxID=1636152 RepID=UPI0018D38CF0|nr:Calx-beta domain-containing protein [Planctomyces sp. SH-PL62]
MERRVLPATFLVETAADDGPGSLRWALAGANADVDPTPTTILFAIPGDGPRTIQLQSPLAPITRPVLIEGRSQPGYQGAPLIRLDGSNSGAGVWNGLIVSGGRSVIAGLSVTGFTGAGIILTGAGGDFVEATYVGLLPDGETPSGNGVGVLILGSSGHTIGGAEGQGNLISGNRGAGVRVAAVEAGDAARNVILGNRIGTVASGASAMGNGQDGVTFVGATSGRIVDNVISGNQGNGITLTGRSVGNLILGNVVGLTAAGLEPLGNSRDGVLVDGSPGNQIGGLSPSEGNQISANAGSGVQAGGDASGLMIQGNQIGSDASGTRALGNQQNGVTLRSSGVTVGGKSDGAGNLIAFNGQGTTGAGVQLIGLVRLDTILSNRIFANSGLGIDFGNGPTPNHTPGESDGPNDWINSPLLAAASTDGLTTRADGSFLGAASRKYTIQFFWSRKVDRSGFGEGERFLGESQLTTDGDGRANFALPIPASLTGGYLSATATDVAGNTSEFSQSVLIRPYADLNVTMLATPALAPQGSPITFTATVTNRGHLVAHSVDLIGRLPGTATILSAQSSQGGLSIATDSGSGTQLAFRVGDLDPGASAVLTVVVQPPIGLAGDFVATASATMTELDSRPGDESAVATARLAAVADLSLALAGGPSSAHRGDVLTYVLTAANAGPGTATNVVLTLPIGAGASFVEAKGPQGNGKIQAGRLVVNLGSLASGASASVTISLRADASGVYTADAVLASDAFDPVPLNASATLTTLVLGRTDLKLSMQAPAVAAQGRDLTYFIVVSNDGPDTARKLVVQDLIPAQADFISADLDGGTTSFGNGVVTARLDALASGGTATIRLVVRPSAAPGVVLTNAARVTGDVDDGDLGNNVAWRETTVRPAVNLGLTIEPTSPTILQGQAATFRIRVSNQGPATEPGAVLAVVVPAGAKLGLGSRFPGPPPTLAAGVLTFRLGAIGVGESAEVTIVLTPDPKAVGPLVLAASVGGDYADVNSADDAATASLTVLPAADLAVYVDPPSAVHERSTFQYTLTAANRSASATTGVRLSATLPEGVAFVSAVASQGSAPVFQSGSVTVWFGDLAGYSTATVTITVRPTSSAGAVLLLSGAATSDLPDPSSVNDVGRYAVTVSPAVDLTVRLRPLRPDVERGGDVTWVAEVWNASLTTATGVVLDIPYEAGGAFVGSATTQGTVRASGGRITALVGTLAPRAYATIAFVLKTQAVGTTTLTAFAAADQFESNPDDSRSSAAVSVIEPIGTLRFAAPEVSVPETAGVAWITVERADGARGTVTVRYRTTPGDAVPGVDYQPAVGVLTFQPGQSTAAIPISVLPYAHNRGDASFGLILEDATGGAVVGDLTTTRVVVRDLDPDRIAPTVDRVTLLGDPSSIGGLAIGFSEPLRPDSATNGAGYTLYDLGPNGVFGDGDDSPIAYAGPGYDPTTRTVYLTPAAPMVLGRNYAVVVRGAGGAALTDVAGNPLGGGFDFVGLFARGTSLKYTDSNGDAVSLQVKNGGYLDLIRSAAGEARLLSLRGVVPGKTQLSGTVSKPRTGGDGVTRIDAVEGLGAFGDVRVALKSPPFLTAGLPVSLPRPIRPITAPLVRPGFRVGGLVRQPARSR